MKKQIPLYGTPGVKLPRLNRKDLSGCVHKIQAYVKYDDVKHLIEEQQKRLTPPKKKIIRGCGTCKRRSEECEIKVVYNHGSGACSDHGYKYWIKRKD